MARTGPGRAPLCSASKKRKKGMARAASTFPLFLSTRFVSGASCQNRQQQAAGDGHLAAEIIGQKYGESGRRRGVAATRCSFSHHKLRAVNSFSGLQFAPFLTSFSCVIKFNYLKPEMRMPSQLLPPESSGH